MKSRIPTGYILFVVAALLLALLIRDGIPYLTGHSASVTDNKKIAVRKYSAPDDESSDYYRGYAAAIEAINENPELLNGTNAYDEIWHAGFEFGYEEGINGVEY